jgi:hypothetical protein
MEVLGHCARRSEPPRWFLLERLERDRLQVARQAPPQPPRRHGLGVSQGVQNLNRRIGEERRSSGEKLIKHSAQSVDVGGRADDCSPACLLWSHVLGGTQGHSSRSQVLVPLD